MIKTNSLKRYINGRKVTKFYGLLHNQFKCAEEQYYEKNPNIDMKVISVGTNVEYHIVNKNLEEKWLGQ